MTAETITAQAAPSTEAELAALIVEAGRGGGALVTEGMVVPPNSLVMGIPAKVIKEVPAPLAERSRKGTAGYVRFAKAHKTSWQ